MKVLRELATLVLCLKDGISTQDIESYICPNLISLFEIENLDSAITALYDGTQNSYFLEETTILHELMQLEQTKLDKLIAITSMISALPLNKEETLQLMIPKAVISINQKGTVTPSANISSQAWNTVSTLNIHNF